jgi:thermitase
VVTVTSAITSQATTCIQTSGTVTVNGGGSSVVFEGGTKVYLLPGFTAQAGSTVRAFIAAIGPEITTTSLPSGVAGTAYAAAVSAMEGTSAGPFTWSGSGLPAWLTQNTSTGALSGSAVAGTFNFSVTATDASGNSSLRQALAVTIAPLATVPTPPVPAPAVTTLTITTSSLPGGTVGTSYSQTLAASGGTPGYTWAIGSGVLPGGLTLTAKTIGGTPTVAGPFAITVKVTDSGNPAQTATQDLTLLILPAASITKLVPNDPQLGAQWALQNIQAEHAWSLSPDRFLARSTASPGRSAIAVLDSGADCTHPDFMNAGGRSTDSAAGGQLSFALSKAYYLTTVPSPACAWQDDFGHGTHIAGIIAAAANNTVGVAGLGYPLQLMVYKVLDAQGQGDAFLISQAIIDAANNGAAVISMSLGSAGYSPTLQNAVNYAWRKNALVVAETGDSGSNALSFPGGANYAIGVGATDSNDTRAGFSGYGNQVAAGAPGVDILSTLPGASYGFMSGTSMAAAHVAALAGLLYGASPGASAASLKMRIEQSADNSNPGGAADKYLGYGRIDVAHALSGNLPAATEGGITGQVVDPVYHDAIGNVVIDVAGQTYTTDYQTGFFRFYGLTAGQYTISASAAGYPALSQQVVIAPGADTQLTITMGGSPAQFTGTVADRGIPVAGAIVQALSAGLIQATAVTGSNGQYFLYVPAGTYTIQASGMYFVTTAAGAQTVSGGASSTVNLTLPSMGRISGNITLSDGSPATATNVAINGSTTTTSTMADANGNFSTIGLPADTYTVVGSLPGWAGVTASAVVGTDTDPSLSLQFAYSGRNTGSGLTSGYAGAGTFPIRNDGAQPDLSPASAPNTGRDYPLQRNEATFSGRLIVRFTPGTVASAAIESAVPGASFIAMTGTADQIYLVSLPGSASQPGVETTQSPATRAASARLAAQPNVVYVEPDRILAAQIR